jgi:hypothetical protein
MPMIKEVELEYTENNLVRLVRNNYGDSAIEYLVGRLTSVINENQLKVLIDYEKKVKEETIND